MRNKIEERARITQRRGETQRLAELGAKTIGRRSSWAVAVVAVEIADLEVARIVLKNTGLESECRDFGGSEGAGGVSEGWAWVDWLELICGGELLTAKS